MKTIEFLGASGIGKSTFMTELVKVRGNDMFWISSREALQHVVNQDIGLAGKVKRKFISATGLAVPDGAKNDYLKTIKANEADCSLLVEMFLERLNQTKLQPWQKVRLYDYYIKKVLYNILKMKTYGFNKTIVFDEGIIHNGGIEAVFYDYDKYRDVVDSKIFPRGVIFFELDENRYLERIESRFTEKGRREINPLMVNVSDREIEEYVIKAKKKPVDALEPAGYLMFPY